MTVALIIAVLLLANAVFVAAEFAIVAVPRTAVEHRASQGEGLSRRLLELPSSPQQRDRFIATAQFGISVASLGLGMYGERRIAGVPRLPEANGNPAVLEGDMLNKLLQSKGIGLPKQALADSAADAAARAKDIGFPVALKLIAADVVQCFRNSCSTVGGPAGAS